MMRCLNTHLIDDLEVRGDCTHLGELFTRLVDALRDQRSCENVYVNDLLGLTWRLVGNKQVLFAAHSQVPSLSFIVLGQTPPQIRQDVLAIGLNPPLQLDKEACFLSPLSWLEQCKTNLTFCLGGLVFNASQCRDFWNNKIDPKLSRQRAMGYEAEFLHLAMKRQPFKPNDYQHTVMTKYPHGVASIRHLLYDCRTYHDAH
jgi:hypothetical protein